MHDTAIIHGRRFFKTYCENLADATIVDIGAQDVNGSLRSVAPGGLKYIGVDFVAGKGVDIVLEDPYCLPFADNSVDVVVSSSCFEHAEFFWLLFLTISDFINGLSYPHPENFINHSAEQEDQRGHYLKKARKRLAAAMKAAP